MQKNTEYQRNNQTAYYDGYQNTSQQHPSYQNGQKINFNSTNKSSLLFWCWSLAIISIAAWIILFLILKSGERDYEFSWTNNSSFMWALVTIMTLFSVLIIVINILFNRKS